MTRLRVVAVCVAASVVAACTSAEMPDTEPRTSPTPVTGGTLVLGVVGEPPAGKLDRATDPGSRALRQLEGTWNVVERTPGLEVVHEPAPGAEPLLGRLIVRFVQSLDIALDLLQDERLDAALLPSAVNLLERLNERGLEGRAILGNEVVYLDLRGSDLPVSTRSALAAAAEVRSLDAAFVRGLGRPTDTLHPGPSDPGSAGSSEGPAGRAAGGRGVRLELATPVGDELLALMQRALHDDWEDRGFSVDVVSIDARTFYGEWMRRPPVDVALRRGAGDGLPDDSDARRTLDAIPLFQVASVIAWRDGINVVLGGRAGPLSATERWWVGDG